MLKESLLLPVHFSHFLYLCMQWTKEKKRNIFVLCLEQEHSETKQMIANTVRCNGYSYSRWLRIIEWFCWDLFLLYLIFFGFFGCQTSNFFYLIFFFPSFHAVQADPFSARFTRWMWMLRRTNIYISMLL